MLIRCHLISRICLDEKIKILCTSIRLETAPNSTRIRSRNIDNYTVFDIINCEFLKTTEDTPMKHVRSETPTGSADCEANTALSCRTPRQIPLHTSHPLTVCLSTAEE